MLKAALSRLTLASFCLAFSIGPTFVQLQPLRLYNTRDTGTEKLCQIAQLGSAFAEFSPNRLQQVALQIVELRSACRAEVRYIDLALRFAELWPAFDHSSLYPIAQLGSAVLHNSALRFGTAQLCGFLQLGSAFWHSSALPYCTAQLCDFSERHSAIMHAQLCSAAELC